MEDKVVMDITLLDETSEFPLACLNSKNLAGSQRTTVDLNEAPFKIKEEHLARLRALCRAGKKSVFHTQHMNMNLHIPSI